MGALIDEIKSDLRFHEALKACMNCGMCTAVCPAAEFYDYDPRRICEMVQRNNEPEIENLLRTDSIWFCGQCMSCKPRCPRGNAPGEIINILRKISQEKGYFKDSNMGRQQVQIMNSIGSNILEIGYCVHPDKVNPDSHIEQGPVWRWYIDNIEELSPKLGANYHGDGSGALRKISREDIDEINKIFETTGGMKFRKTVLEP